MPGRILAEICSCVAVMENYSKRMTGSEGIKGEHCRETLFMKYLQNGTHLRKVTSLPFGVNMLFRGIRFSQEKKHKYTLHVSVVVRKENLLNFARLFQSFLQFPIFTGRIDLLKPGKVERNETVHLSMVMLCY